MNTDEIRIASGDLTLMPIPGYPNYYASELGDIWSSWEWNGTLFRKLKPSVNRRGYLILQLVVGGKRKTVKVHTLVCTAFHGMRPVKGIEVRHLDGNRQNNSSHNLAWGTQMENFYDAVRHGTRVHFPVIARFDDGTLLRFASVSEAGRSGFRRGSIRLCAMGKLRSHKGAKWSYADGAAMTP